MAHTDSSTKLAAMIASREKLNAQMASMQRGRKDYWLSDSQVAESLNAIDARQGVVVYWPTGMQGNATALSQDDANYFEHMMADPLVQTVVIPENSGAHWSLAVIRRDQDGAWQSYQVATKADGTCGRSTVNQAQQLSDVAAEHWQASVARRVQSSGEGAMRAALPTVAHGVKLPKILSSAVPQTVAKPKAQASRSAAIAEQRVMPQLSGAITEAEYEDDQTAHAIHQSTRELSRVDYILSRMSTAEMAGDEASLQQYQTQLIDTINAMDAGEAGDTRDRLKSIGEKASIQAVYEATDRSASSRLSP